MASAPGIPTLDQLRILVEIVDAGSFTAAAKKTNRALSVISYAVSNLEQQLGTAVFDRGASRKPILTEAGRVVLTEARAVVRQIDGLRAKVHGMLQGIEGELHIVLNVLFASERVLDTLGAFRDAFPTVDLTLHVETLGGVPSLVLGKVATVGFTSPITSDYPELSRIRVGSLRMVAVAGPTHPLASPPPGGHRPGAAREHVQLVVYDRSTLTKGVDFSVSSDRTWRLADLSAKHTLLKRGIGWGMMPEWMVIRDLECGALVELDMPDRAAFDYLVDAIYRTDTPLGPAATWLIERIRGLQNCF